MDNMLKHDLLLYVDKLKNIYGDYLKEVVLYGSCAKNGYYNEDSDIDILILVDLDDISIKEYQSVLAEATYEMFLDKALYITPIVLNYGYFFDWKDSHKFYKKIDIGGIRLYKDDSSIVEKINDDIESKKIKIGVCQFNVSADIKENYEKMWEALLVARYENVQLLVFTECALTGVPSVDIETSEDVDFETLEFTLNKLQKIAHESGIHILLGAVTKHKDKFYNSAILLTNDIKRIYYNKRVLIGKDRNNFIKGDEAGIFMINGVKIGVRIGQEVCYPEYFREQYKKNTDLNIILYNNKLDDNEEYKKIKGYIATRAYENITHTLVAGATKSIESSLYDKSGNIMASIKRGKEDILVFEIDNFDNSYEELARKQVVDEIIE